MSTVLADYADRTRRLHASVRAVERRTQIAQVPPLAGREWFELLERKLLPQLTDDSYLIVAVVGGTNIGKSCVFNHVAGFRASAVSPLASGTKHPTCLVPTGFLQRHDLATVFPGFTLRPWDGAEAPLVEEGVDWLFWRETPELPENLLVLDTPDVDSDAKINWVRADNIRRAADVLLAVLTQQKYNDAAVKEFFRNAAAEDKACLIVLNQVLLPEDEPWWPKWLATFCHETQVKPEIVYIAPNDRRAAEQNRLPFYERPWPISDEAVSATIDPETYDPGPPRNLLEDLTNLRFAEIKVRTLRGSLQQLLDESHGAPGYLREVRQRAVQFRGAAELLTAHQLAATDHWPAIPPAELVAALRRWWAAQRTGWSGKVHGFYNTLGQGLAWPFRKVAERLQGEAKPPLEIYRDREWTAILEVVQKVFEKLTFISELGNDLLKPRLATLLSGTSRSELIELIRRQHERIDFDQLLQDLVTEELAGFREESPASYQTFKRIDSLAAAARPVTSVILFMTGFGPVGHAVAPVVTDTLLQGALHLAGDVVGGTVAVGVGETVIGGGVSTGAGYLEMRFRKLHSTFTERRALWLANLLKQHLLGTLNEDLHAAATIDQSPEFRAAEEAIVALRKPS